MIRRVDESVYESAREGEREREREKRMTNVDWSVTL